MAILVELDRQTVERLIDEKCERLEQLDGEMTSVSAEITRLKAALEAAKNGSEPKSSGLPVPPAKTPTGRAKRGESEKLIVNFFRAAKPNAVSVAKLVKMTGLKYGTANRIVHLLAEQKKVKSVNGQWAWAE
jgi:hypothetical protein